MEDVHISQGEIKNFIIKKEEHLPDEVKRLIEEQITLALENLYAAKDDISWSVHEIRKSFKKIRAILRMVRYELGHHSYKSKNIIFRDLGRILAPLRDSDVFIGTWQYLSPALKGKISHQQISGTMRKIKNRQKKILYSFMKDKSTLTMLKRTLQQEKSEISNLPLEKNDFSLFHKGILRIFERGRNEMKQAQLLRTTKNLHNWRKRVKYLWYHIQLLQNIWPGVLSEYEAILKELADILGEEHDLADLKSLISSDKFVPNKEYLIKIIEVLQQERYQKQEAAWPLGLRIYNEKPASFVNRLQTYWNASMVSSQ